MVTMRIEDELEMKSYATKPFINFFDTKYPALRDNIEFRKLFMYLAFGTNPYAPPQEDHEEQEAVTGLLLSYRQVAYVIGKTISAHNNNFRALEFLQNFRASVMPDFAWSDYEAPGNKWIGKCRIVLHKGFDAHDLQVIENELKSQDSERYYFATGKKISFNHTSEVRKETLALYQEDQKLFNLNPSQQKIVDGLAEVSHNGRAFVQKAKANRERIALAIDALEAKPEDKMPLEEKKAEQRKLIASIEEDGRIFYRPTPFKRTPRLHHSSECTLSLKGEVRKALCHGWVEADLISSQFVILAALLKAPVSLAFANSGEHLWTHLNEFCGGTGAPDRDTKKFFKEVVYGICFGKSEGSLNPDGTVCKVGKNGKKLAERSLTAICHEAGKLALLDNAIIRELLHYRERWFKHIEEKGYLEDIWGTKHYLEGAKRKEDIYGNYLFAQKRWAGSLAATQIQSIELEIISSVFDCQEKYGSSYMFNIMLFQHDGFTFSANKKDKLEVVQSRLNTFVQNKAALLSEATGLDLSAVKLEFKQL